MMFVDMLMDPIEGDTGLDRSVRKGANAAFRTLLPTRCRRLPSRRC